MSSITDIVQSAAIIILAITLFITTKTIRLILSMLAQKQDKSDHYRH